MGDGAQSDGVGAGDLIAHFPHQEVFFRMRHLEQAHGAAAAEARGGLQRALGPRPVDAAPIGRLDEPAEEEKGDGEAGEDRPIGAERQRQKHKQHRAGHQAIDEVARQHEGAAPLPDRLQAGVDHRRAGDGDERHDGSRRAHDGEQPAGVVEKDPADAENRDRHEGEHRRDALARQPGRTPLR